MVDNFSLLVSHGLIALAVFRLLWRDDLDHEAPPEPDTEPAGFAAKRPAQKADGADA